MAVIKDQLEPCITSLTHQALPSLVDHKISISLCSGLHPSIISRFCPLCFYSLFCKSIKGLALLKGFSLMLKTSFACQALTDNSVLRITEQTINAIFGNLYFQIVHSLERSHASKLKCLKNLLESQLAGNENVSGKIWGVVFLVWCFLFLCKGGHFDYLARRLCTLYPLKLLAILHRIGSRANEDEILYRWWSMLDIGFPRLI